MVRIKYKPGCLSFLLHSEGVGVGDWIPDHPFCQVDLPHPSHRHPGIKGESITRYEIDAGAQYFLDREELLRRLVFELGAAAVCDVDGGL